MSSFSVLQTLLGGQAYSLRELILVKSDSHGEDSLNCSRSSKSLEFKKYSQRSLAALLQDGPSHVCTSNRLFLAIRHPVIHNSIYDHCAPSVIIGFADIWSFSDFFPGACYFV